MDFTDMLKILVVLFLWAALLFGLGALLEAAFTAVADRVRSRRGIGPNPRT
jgi:hypothetical protein